MKQNSPIETTQAAAVTTLPGIETSAPRVGAILSISPIEADHCVLEQMLATLRCTLHRAGSIASAKSFLVEYYAPVMICERDLSPGTWRDILDWASSLHDPPHLIVTSPLADEHLWAEALNLGAYDVLPKPFERGEVTRIVRLAACSWHEQRRRTSVAARVRPVLSHHAALIR